MAEGADRTVRVAATVALAVTLATIAAAMVAGTTARSPLPAVLVWCAFALNVVVLLVLLLRRPDPFVALTAVVLGVAVAIPLITVATQSVAAPNPVIARFPTANPPVMAALAGSAATLGVLAAPAWGRDRILRWLAIGGTAFVWLTILLGLQSLAEGPIDAAYHRNERDWIGLWQLKGLAGHPNALAVTGALVLLVQVVALAQSGRRMSRGARLAAALIGPGATLLVILWTQSRTGWIAAALGLGALAVPWHRIGRWATPVVAAIWLGLLLAAPLVAKVWDVTFNGRNQAWERAESIITDNPGAGLGTFAFSPEYWALIAGFEGYDGWMPMHAHNALLQAGVQRGVPGLVVVVAAWCLVGTVALGARAVDSGLGIAAVTSMAVYASVEPALGVGPGGAVYLPVVLFAVVVGSSAALHRAGQEGPPADLGDRAAGPPDEAPEVAIGGKPVDPDRAEASSAPRSARGPSQGATSSATPTT